LPNPLTAAAIVDEYLHLPMIPYPAFARRYWVDELQMRFSGGRALRESAECAAFNATRCRWVKKRIDATETAAACKPGRTVVYSPCTQHGERPDGTLFDADRDVERCADRPVDRCDSRRSFVAQVEFCNDSAERLLDRAAREPSQ
jgi:hypothetical protein